MGDLYDDSIFTRREKMLKQQASKNRWVTMTVLILLSAVLIGLALWRFRQGLITAPASTEKPRIMQVSIPDKSPINVNSASVEQLMQLPGVGASMAEEIVKSRPYANAEDLKRVPGIGDKTLQKMKSRVVVE